MVLNAFEWFIGLFSTEDTPSSAPPAADFTSVGFVAMDIVSY